MNVRVEFSSVSGWRGAIGPGETAPLIGFDQQRVAIQLVASARAAEIAPKGVSFAPAPRPEGPR